MLKVDDIKNICYRTKNNKCEKIKKGRKVVKMKEKLIKQGGITIIQLVLIVVVIVIVISIIKWGKIFNRKDEKVGKEEESMQTVMQEENVGKLENGTKMNTSAKLAEEKEVAGLKVTGIQLTKNETWSKIIATVKNEGNIEEGNFTVEIDVKDKD